LLHVQLMLATALVEKDGQALHVGAPPSE